MHLAEVGGLARLHDPESETGRPTHGGRVELSTPMTGALKYLQEEAGHTCDISFADAGPTIRFMEMMYRSFLLMDVSNCTQHIHQNQPDSKEYHNTGDERLVWLVEYFIEFLKATKKDSDHSHFFSKETYEALLLITESNAQCVKYLLAEKKFQFVLTRKMSSDPIVFFWVPARNRWKQRPDRRESRCGRYREEPEEGNNCSVCEQQRKEL